jgi:undecaprenyl-diphosphatase
MFFDYFFTLILAIIQGVTEFIPVSSSSHLIIFSKVSKFNYGSLEIDVGLHLGSLLAIVVYFRKDLIEIKKNKNLVLLFLFGSLPLFIVGFLIYYSGLISYLRNIHVIAWTTLIFGILLYISDKFKINKNLDKDLNIKNIFFVGIFQCLALIPGVSRAGITITAARFLKFDRFEASKISFYLSIPALAGASFLGLQNILDNNIDFSLIVLISSMLSFIFSYLTIKYFLIYVKRYSLDIFAYYRIFLALLLFIVIYS